MNRGRYLVFAITACCALLLAMLARQCEAGPADVAPLPQGARTRPRDVEGVQAPAAPRDAPIEREPLADRAGEPRIEVRGRVADARSGAPVQTEVACLDDEGWLSRVRAGADGAFEVACLPGRAHRFLVRHDARHWGAVRALAAEDLAAGAEVELLLEPRRALPVVFLTPGGEALTDVARPPKGHWTREAFLTVAATAAPCGESLASEPRPFRVGRFRASFAGEAKVRPDAPLGFAGELDLLAPPPAYCHLVLRERVLQSSLIDQDRDLIEFVVDPAVLASAAGSVALRVLDARTMSPPEEKLGIAFREAGDHRPHPVIPLGADGRVELEGVPAGAIDLRLEIAGYAYQAVEVEVVAGRRNDLGEFLVEPGACITGRIVSPEREPVEAKVWCSVPGDRSRPLGGFSNMPQNPDLFAACSLPRGPVWIGIDGPEWAVNPTEVDASSGMIRDVELVARAGGVLCIEAGFAGGTLHRLDLADAQGRSVWLGDCLEPASREVRLLAGRYTLRASGPGGRLRTFDVEVKDGERTEAWLQ